MEYRPGQNPLFFIEIFWPLFICFCHSCVDFNESWLVSFPAHCAAFPSEKDEKTPRYVFGNEAVVGAFQGQPTKQLAQDLRWEAVRLLATGMALWEVARNLKVDRY